MNEIDFGQVAKSYARSREDIPVSLIDSLLIRGIFFDGKKVADIGCGTGALTRKFSMRKADVIGVDPSKELLEQAETINQLKSYSIPYKQGTAEDTGLQAAQFDIVSVMRAWHWFNRPKALQEMKRILKPKGTLIIIDSGFLSGTEEVEKTFEVLSKYTDLMPAGTKGEARQRINGFPVEWFEEWQTGGFELRDFYKLNYSVTFTKENWIERIESISWLAGMEEEMRKKSLQEIAGLFERGVSYTIPHECNVCILKR